MNALPEGVIRLGRKEYHTVAKRVNDFRAAYGDMFGIWTEIIQNDDIVVISARIVDKESGFPVAMGHAEEKRGSSQVNRTSALENCETSAIGRALAAFGIGGTEFASANEVENAIHQQEGHSQGNDQGAVSPPNNAAPAQEWAARPKGEKPTKTDLDRIVKELTREIEACGDREMLDGYTSTDEYQKGKAALEEHRPSALYGPPPVNAPEFTPIKDLIVRKVALFKMDPHQPTILEAG